MSNFPIRHTYATPQQFKSYLNASSAPAWTADDAGLLTLLEAVSRRIDHYLGGRSVGPHLDTIDHDLGPGAAHSDVLVYGHRRFLPSWDTSIMMSPTVASSIVALRDWLLVPTAVTVYQDTTRAHSQILAQTVAGQAPFVNGDYILDPTWEEPKRYLKMNESSVLLLYAGQGTLSISGLWGWQSSTLPLDTLGAAITDTTSPGITNATELALVPGQTLLIDAEQMYVRACPTATTATVLRGVNGTTATTHLSGTQISIYELPPEIVDATLDIARVRWRGRQMGNTMQIADPQQGVSLPSPAAEELAILHRLDNPFRTHAFPAGVF